MRGYAPLGDAKSPRACAEAFLVTRSAAMGAKDQAAVAKQTTDPDELRALASSRFTAVRAAVAQNGATPDEVLKVLAEDRHHLPRFAIANNPKPSASALALRATDNSVRRVLAQRQDLPAAVIQALLQDPERDVRRGLGWSTRDEGVLRSLAADADSHVRSVVPFNAVTPDDLIDTLSRDPDRGVRCSVVTSYRASEEQLQRLLRDKSSLVRYWVLQYYSRRPDILAALDHDPDSEIAQQVTDLRAGRGHHGVSDLIVAEAGEKHRHRSIAQLT